MLRWVQAVTGLIFVLTLAALSYHYLTARSEGEVYREKLEDAQKQVASLSHAFEQLRFTHEQLRATYNEAVAKTAVTELVVEDGTLCVNIRTAEGVDRSIPTPFDPRKEIYVDYVVLDGRLWIRRVFDHDTPPGQALVIDPKRGDIDWSDPRLTYGNAVYRSLSEGRWIVTVTGDGSLGLVKSDKPAPALSPPPVVKDYPQM